MGIPAPIPKLDSKTLTQFQKDLENVNDSDWTKVQEHFYPFGLTGMISTMEYATAVLKKRNVINWKVKSHPEVLTAFLERILECCKQPLVSGGEAETYTDFMQSVIHLLNSLTKFAQQQDVLWEMVKTALQSDSNRLHAVIATFSK